MAHFVFVPRLLLTALIAPEISSNNQRSSRSSSQAAKSLMRTLAFAVASLVFVVGSLCSSWAQATGSVLGEPALQKYINVGGGVDEINTGDLTVHVSIPLASKGSYGPPVNTSLDMDSRTYMYNYGGGNQIYVSGGFGFHSTARFSVGFVFTPGSGDCATFPYPQLSVYPVYDGTGTSHPAIASVVGCGGGALYPPGNNGDGWAAGVALAWNPPFFTYYGVAISPSGLTGGIIFPPQTQGCYPYQVRDLHGNSINDNVCWNAPSTGVSMASGTVTDATGNEVLTASLASTDTVLLQYPGPNNTTPTYTLTFTPYTVNSDFGCAGLKVLNPYTTPLLTKIVYPDGSAESFTYESNPLHSGTTTLRIATITVPTGATYTYTYTGGTHGVNCSDGTTSGITKVTPDGTWTITHTAGSGSANLSTTKVVAPSGDYAIDSIVSVPGNVNTPFVIPQTNTVASLSYSSSGTLLASKYYCYSGYHPTSPLSCANPPSAAGFAVSEIDEWTYVPGVTNPSLTVTLLDPYMRVTDVKAYDFGGTVGGASYDTDVQTAYGSWNGSSCVNITVPYPNFGTYPLMDRVCSRKTVINGGTTVSNSYFTYGTSGNGLGELLSQQATIGGKLVTIDARTYDNVGRVLTSIGPNGETTISTYTQCAGHEVSSVTHTTDAIGDGLTTTYSGYDCVGEKYTAVTDANGHQSTINYGTDPFWRPVSGTDAGGVTTTYTYIPASGSTPATFDKQMTIVAGQSSTETLTQFDLMGRPKLSQVRQGPASSQYTITETDYDAEARVSRVTLPYSGAAGTMNSTIDGTRTAYDGIGRKLTVTGPAYSANVPGSTITYTYSANDVLVTQSPAPAGEHAKSRQTETNGLGDITSVCEVTSVAGSSSCGQSTAASGFKTMYAYYPGGNLKNITQNVNGTTQQIRSFTYDNGNTGRLLTATTPESGTYTTTYDSDPAGYCPPFVGFPVKNVDNGGGTACRAYDLADRVVSVTYPTGLNSASTPSKYFEYDSALPPVSLSCNGSPNTAGAIAEASTASGTGGKAFVSGGGTLTGSSSGISDTGLNIYWYNNLSGAMGTVTFATGSLTSGTLSGGGTFASGGSLVVKTNGTDGTPNGPVFSGSFSGTVTWSYTTELNGTHDYTLTGPIVNTGGSTGVLTIVVNTGKGFFSGSVIGGSGSASFGAFTLLTDEVFCYDNVGRQTENFLWTSTGYNGYGHIAESYFNNGATQSLSWITGGWPTPLPPTVNYTLDPMGRPYSATDSKAHTLVSSTSYQLDSSIHTVTFGNGDTSVHTEYANFAPNTETNNVGTVTVSHTPIWNSSGTLNSLKTTDSSHYSNNRTCTFSYDDLVRILTDNCGTQNGVPWNESFVYDPFGNITKSGNVIWPPAGTIYNQSTNRYTVTSGTNPFSYDANGRLLNDIFDTLSWDVNGNLLSQTGTTFVYDAFDRPVSSTVASITTSYVYAPNGSLVATLGGSTHAFSRVFAALPASRVAYTGSSFTLDYVDRYDWQGSVRVSSAWTGNTLSSFDSYDAFGVLIWAYSRADSNFAGLNTDISSGTEQVSASRRYHPSQGRWESPDDHIPDIHDPQSFNGYSYVNNLPTGMTDRSGREPFLNSFSGGQSVNLKDTIVMLNGVQVDPSGYIGWLAYDDSAFGVTTLALAPYTDTPSEPPVLVPDPNGEYTFVTEGGPVLRYNLVRPNDQPEVVAKAQNASATVNTYFLLGTAFFGGLTSGLALSATPEIQVTNFSPPGPWSETFFRGMPDSHLSILRTTGRMPPGTRETMISGVRSYAAKYATRPSTSLVQFELRPGTLQALQSIGVRSDTDLALQQYPDLPLAGC